MLVRQAGRTELGATGFEISILGFMIDSTIVAPSLNILRTVSERVLGWDSMTWRGMRREDHCSVPEPRGGKEGLKCGGDGWTSKGGKVVGQ